MHVITSHTFSHRALFVGGVSFLLLFSPLSVQAEDGPPEAKGAPGPVNLPSVAPAPAAAPPAAGKGAPSPPSPAASAPSAPPEESAEEKAAAETIAAAKAAEEKEEAAHAAAKQAAMERETAEQKIAEQTLQEKAEHIHKQILDEGVVLEHLNGLNKALGDQIVQAQAAFTKAELSEGDFYPAQIEGFQEDIKHVQDGLERGQHAVIVLQHEAQETEEKLQELKQKNSGGGVPQAAGGGASTVPSGLGGAAGAPPSPAEAHAPAPPAGI